MRCAPWLSVTCVVGFVWYSAVAISHFGHLLIYYFYVSALCKQFRHYFIILREGLRIISLFAEGRKLSRRNFFTPFASLLLCLKLPCADALRASEFDGWRFSMLFLISALHADLLPPQSFPSSSSIFLLFNWPLPSSRFLSSERRLSRRRQVCVSMIAGFDISKKISREMRDYRHGDAFPSSTTAAFPFT